MFPIVMMIQKTDDAALASHGEISSRGKSLGTSEWPYSIDVQTKKVPSYVFSLLEATKLSSILWPIIFL